MTDAELDALAWQKIETAPRDQTWFVAKTQAGTERVVHFADRFDRLPIAHDGVIWETAPTHWAPLSAITTLRAQLAESRAERDAIIVARDMMGRLWEKEKARADRAEFNAAQLTVMVGEDAVDQIEAAVAAQIKVDTAIASGHDYDVMGGTDADFRARFIAHSIRNQPHDRTALDAAIRAAKVEAWKEADVATLGLATGRECQVKIRAMIEREGV